MGHGANATWTRGDGRGSGGGVKGKATLIWDHVSLNLYRLFILFTSFFNSDVFLIRILSFARRWRRMRHGIGGEGKETVWGGRQLMRIKRWRRKCDSFGEQAGIT